jgi:hypothetical protein
MIDYQLYKIVISWFVEGGFFDLMSIYATPGSTSFELS